MELHNKEAGEGDGFMMGKRAIIVVNQNYILGKL